MKPYYSIYEEGHPTRQQQDNGISLGRITRVFPERRTCEVKTFLGPGALDDNHIPECQWLSLDAHPDGDESSVIPRAGSFGLVFYISGEVFILGMFSPLTGAGSAEIGDVKEKLNEGDRSITTIAGNKIIVRAHGEIQVESTRTCRTIWFPGMDLINELCRNYEFRTDGGTTDWLNLGDDTTIHRQEFRDSIARNNVIIEEKGNVNGNEFISRTEIGVGTDGGIDQSVWTKTVKTDGSTEIFIRKPGESVGHKTTITPDGKTVIDIAGKTTTTIDSSGEVKLSVNKGKSVLNISPDGKVTLTADSDISITTKAAFNVKSTAAAKIDCSAATIKSSGPTTINASQITLKSSANSIKGGAVSANPANNDPITGLPLTPAGGVELA